MTTPPQDNPLDLAAWIQARYPNAESLTPSEAAPILGCSSSHVRLLCRLGKITAVNISVSSDERFRIPIPALVAFVRSGGTGSSTKATAKSPAGGARIKSTPSMTRASMNYGRGASIRSARKGADNGQ